MFNWIKSIFSRSVSASYNGSNETWTGFNALNSGREMTEKNVNTISTFWACGRNIAEDCGKLPLKFFRKVVINNRKIHEPIDDDKELNVISKFQNERITPFDFYSTMFFWAATWHTGFAEIVWSRGGELLELHPIHPSRIQVYKNKNQTFWYKVYNDDGSTVNIQESNMFTMGGMKIDGYISFDVRGLQQNTLSRANSTDRYARHFYQNNGRPTGALITDETLSPAARINLKLSWAEMYGGVMNAGKTAVLEDGLKYQAFSPPFKDLQFVEQWKHNQLQICEWFRMPPKKVMVESNAKGWATVDAEETEYLVSCLMPWLIRMEQQIRRQLMPRWKFPDDIECAFDFSMILRGDMKTRAEMNTAKFACAAITPNEIRESEGLNPIDDPAMDKTYIQGAFVPVDRAGEHLDNQPKPKEKGGDNGN